jgi:UDP-glucose 4-epimerase
VKTMLVTGAAGFLGRYIVSHFHREGWRVIGVDDVSVGRVQFEEGVEFYSLRLPNPALGELLAETKPTVCVHAAGCASVGLSLDDPGADFRGNTVLTFELLEALRKHAPACRFILLSSAAIYGNPEILPVSEGHPPSPLSPYGFHKLHCEMLCVEYSRFFNLPTASVRIFSAYGAGLKRQVIWDICDRILTKGRLPLHGTGHESRDFIHAKDIARAVEVVAAGAPAIGEVYNVATGREVTIAELAHLLLTELAPDLQPEFDGQATPGNPLNWRADIGKLTALGFVPEISLEDGLLEVARWARAELVPA